MIPRSPRCEVARARVRVRRSAVRVPFLLAPVGQGAGRVRAGRPLRRDLRAGLLLVVGLLFALVPSALAGDRRPDPDRLRIMCLNAEFLWDGLAPEEGSSRVTFPWKGVPDEAREHMADIAQVIDDSDPDIVVLIEVEDLPALELLNATFLAGRGYVAYLDEGIDTFTGQDVGILTRIDPVDGRVEFDDRKGTSNATIKSMSKNCVARFDVGGRKLGLLGVHFLARPDDTSRVDRRQAQADAARSIALEFASEGREVIVCGDFNDFDAAVMDHKDSTPITTVLEDVRRMADGPTDDLVNVAVNVPKAQRFTAFWDRNGNDRVDAPGELSAIDHMLVSPSLAASLTNVAIPHDHDPRAVSDHFPIVIDLAIGPTPDTGGGGGGDGGGGGATFAALRIAAAVPNPPGDETELEQVVLLHPDAAAGTVSLDGWTLRDASGQAWSLTGSIAGGAHRSVLRAGRAMTLNNSGDTIELVAPDGSLVDAVTYGRAAESVMLFFVTPGGP